MAIKKIYNLADRAAQNKWAVPAALIILALSIRLLVWVVTNNQRTATEVSGDDAIIYTEDSPSEDPIPDNYSVPDGDPLSIEIGSAGIKGFIQKVGVDQHQAIAAPNNVNLAGWFRDSVRPGEKGLSIIDGHVNGRTRAGVFKNLSQVKPDDEVVVTMGGGAVHRYKVFDTKTVPNDQAAAVLFEQKPSVASQLNLITCTGRYDKDARTYTERIIVYAELISQ